MAPARWTAAVLFLVLVAGACAPTVGTPSQATPVESAGPTVSGSSGQGPAGRATDAPQQPEQPEQPVRALEPRPDIVLVLMDDFSLELFRTMPQAQRMVREGVSYDNAFVIDSLCCPSRAALLTGQTPRQTGVLTNTPNDYTTPIGGYRAFAELGAEQRQFSISLQDAGYTTGFVGKFLNGYEPYSTYGREPPPNVAGWDDWRAIMGGGYDGWDFSSVHLDAQGEVRMRQHPKPPESASAEEKDRHYATTVAADLAVDFLEEHRDDADPYFLEVATYGTHAALNPAYSTRVFPAAFADKAPPGDPDGGNCGLLACGDLTLADLAGYDDPREDNAPTYVLPDGAVAPAPAWRTNEITLTDDQALTRYRDRARMAQSIDRLVGRVREAAGPDAYVFLTSDNGFHLGQHQLNGGKGAPYDSDTRVPLVVVGPGLEPGVRDQYVNNIDLAPTFEDLAGATTPRYRSGRSFAETLTQPRAEGARYAFFEHTYARSQPGEVDTDEGSGGTIDIIPSYVAVRGDRGLLVRLDLDMTWTGVEPAYELYRYDVGWEATNVFATDHDLPWARDLMRRLELFDGCTPRQCRAAAR